MNYRDDILENKTFNFFKQLMYNLALAICIILVGVLLATYCFGYKLYEVQSDSQAPEIRKYDMVVVKAQDEYKVGDILTFHMGVSTTHRLVATKVENGTTYYICHGDNVQNLDGSYSPSAWEDDKAFVENLIAQGKTIKEIQDECDNEQVLTYSDIQGKVVQHCSNLGAIIVLVKEHTMLLITLIVGIWCVSSVIQNEIEIKKSRRLF